MSCLIVFFKNNWSAMTDGHISVDANIVVLNASKKYSTYFYFYTSLEVSTSFSFSIVLVRYVFALARCLVQLVESYQSIFVRSNLNVHTSCYHN